MLSSPKREIGVGRLADIFLKGAAIGVTACSSRRSRFRATTSKERVFEQRSGSQPVARGSAPSTLYATPAALRDITQGNNGDFAAALGWDACTGLGSPDGVQIATLFGSTPTS